MMTIGVLRLTQENEGGKDKLFDISVDNAVFHH